MSAFYYQPEIDYQRSAPSLQSPVGPQEPGTTTQSSLPSSGPYPAYHGEDDDHSRWPENYPHSNDFVEEKAVALLAGPRTPRRPLSVWQRLERLQYQNWTWEVLTLLVALGCQIAIIVILILMQDQPLERWTAAVSISAVIATLTTAAKGMTLLSVGSCISQLKWVHFKARPQILERLDVFEETSKGPLGAVKMVLSVRDWLPLLGAIIMLLAVGVDAFAQQIITFEPRDVPKNDSEVLFGITRNYSAQTHANAGSGLNGINLGNTEDIKMQGAIIRGLYDIQTIAQFKCSSRCSWPGSFTTLGFETTCQNVTQALISTRKCEKSTGLEEYTLCNMTTPGNLSLSTYMAATNWQTTLDVATTSMINLNKEDPVSPDFLQLAVLRVPNQYNENDGTTDLVGEEAIECTMRLSGWEYTNMSASGNKFTAEHTRSIALGNYTDQMTTDFWTFPTQTNSSQEFTIRKYDLLAIIDYLRSPAFAGNMTIGLLTNIVNNGNRLPLATGNMTATLDKMAQSMTEYIRSGPNSQMMTGQLVEPVVFVRVQGAWLALPLFIQIAGIALLWFTAIQSRQARGIQLWKSSSLALLFASYDRQGASIIVSKEKPVHIVEFAKTVKAKTD